MVAAGQAVGVSAEATGVQHTRPGVVHRLVRAAPPVEVRLAWWADSPPPHVEDLVALVREQYATGGPGRR